jgi:hypothetical protein
VEGEGDVFGVEAFEGGIRQGVCNEGENLFDEGGTGVLGLTLANNM